MFNPNFLVSCIHKNRDIIECSGLAQYIEDEDGYVKEVKFHRYSIMFSEVPCKSRGIAFKTSFHEGKFHRFSIVDYLDREESDVEFNKKCPGNHRELMSEIINSISMSIINEIQSIHRVTRSML